MKRIPVIMAYEEGFSPEDLSKFVEGVWKFHLECKEQYKDQPIEYHFMPREVAENFEEFMAFLEYKKSLAEEKQNGSN